MESGTLLQKPEDASTHSASPSPPPLEDKAQQIAAACRENDVSALIALATACNGLVNDDLRRTAWPILLGSDKEAQLEPGSWKSLAPHRDEDQVKLDVNRSFVYYPRRISDKELERWKQDLSDVITQVLRRHPALCYFQGYHDIVQVLLLVLGSGEAPAAMTRLSLLRIRDFMLPTLEGAISHLHLIHPILSSIDPLLQRHLAPTQPFFALAATLTLYAHDIENYGDIARLFDFFLAREAVIPVYFFAVVILARKDELLEIPLDEPEMLHFTLSKLPQPLDLEFLISQTDSLFRKHPPESLPGRVWWWVSSNSVLKTTRDPANVPNQSIQQGEELFKRQEVDLRRRQVVQKAVAAARKQARLYRRPASALGLAMAVGVLAWWMGRNGGINIRHYGIGPFTESIRRVFSLFV